jgi:hypothetical protein
MVSHRGVIWILIVSMYLASCRSFASDSPTPFDQPQDKPGSASEPTALAETPTPVPDYARRIRNAKYQLGFVDALRIVQLNDGKFEQGAPGSTDYVSVTVTNFTAHGDLNGDGFDEYAALIAENYSGSGVFVFLAVFAEVNGELIFQTSTYVDDRPKVTGLEIANEKIYLSATTHKTVDPMCCPTLDTARHYRLVKDQLDTTDYVTFSPDGRPRTITIDSPASGTEVFSSVPIKGTVAIAPFENTLAYHIYDVGGTDLAIGSITVTTADPGAPGTFEQTILLGNILSGTAIRIEVQDISAEDGSLFAMDSVELVVK